ncbi:MAG: CYTH domain-containing protein [Verrucomicrobiales bacterium]
MGTEIERKFLVCGSFPEESSTRLVQAYLSLDRERTIRIRLDGPDDAFITIKGKTEGISRSEFEYAIPPEDAEEMLKLAVGAPIEKIRHRTPIGKHTWEVDVFSGENEGLVVAEIELESEDEPFEKPDWIGEEVTSDSQYLNACLAQKPFSAW